MIPVIALVGALVFVIAVPIIAFMYVCLIINILGLLLKWFLCLGNHKLGIEHEFNDDNDLKKPVKI